MDLRGLAALLRASEGDIARLSNGDVWGDVEVFFAAAESSHTLCDFLCVRSWESTNMEWRSGRRGNVTGGELGGVPPDMFCMDPGGEEFGVM